MEDKGSTSSTFSVSAGYSQDRTGWKATHKREDTAGQGAAIMNENNMGCIYQLKTIIRVCNSQCF